MSLPSSSVSASRRRFFALDDPEEVLIAAELEHAVACCSTSTVIVRENPESLLSNFVESETCWALPMDDPKLEGKSFANGKITQI